jgi:hypothetical protein
MNFDGVSENEVVVEGQLTYCPNTFPGLQFIESTTVSFPFPGPSSEA